MSDQVKYGHGGRVYALARELGLGAAQVLDFSASINPLGPPAEVKATLAAELDLLLSHYPEVEAAELGRALADGLGLAYENLAVANGSTEPIHLLPLAAKELTPSRRALIIAPAFSEYRAGLDRAGWRVEHFLCRAEDDFVPDAAALAGLIEQGDYGLVYLGQPANPTGALLEPARVLDLARLQEAKGGLLIVDEAFIDFAPQAGVLDRLDDHPALVVLRSLTKFFALPGLRLGYVAARREVIGGFKALQHPWSVNALAQRAGLLCLDQADYAARTRALIEQERSRLSKALAELGLTVYPSAANYLLARLGAEHPPAEAVVKEMMGRAILIRDCANFEGLAAGYLRLAIRLPEENERLIEALREMLARA